MRSSHKLTRSLSGLLALIMLLAAAFGADPGIPASSTGSSGAGHIIIYNFYTSSATNPVAEDTLIAITNISEQASVFVHLFFVDGDTCSVADSYICLTRSQTTKFLASDVDPGVSGYLIAVAVDRDGVPLASGLSSFSGAPLTAARGEAVEAEPVATPTPSLIGDELVKLSSGSAGNLTAEVMTVPTPTPTPCVECEGAPASDLRAPRSAPSLVRDIPSEITLSFARLPRVLAVDSIPSQLDGNSTLLVVDRIGGDLRESAAPLGPMFGIVYDQLENPYSFTFTGRCKFRGFLNNSTFPRTSPRLNQIIPSGATGWMKFWAVGSASDPEPAIVGTVINFNPRAASSATSYNFGHNLHALTFTETVNLTLPVFPPNCN